MIEKDIQNNVYLDGVLKEYEIFRKSNFINLSGAYEIMFFG